ncbi:MAG: class I SAM-dependent methyltransferase [Thermoplasmata archaeon]|nr:class I SAM-dependent methyltransferase [Thermoplasmata archaeon]
MTGVLPDVLEEQRSYYRARAQEYDQWWNREGRYDRGGVANAQWLLERHEVEQLFDSLPFGHRVLELAPGTGIWTERLARRGLSVTAVDASEEMLAMNRARLGLQSTRVDYRVADLFDWTPTLEFDAAVICFWISHIPRRKIGQFLSGVAQGVRPGGTVFFLDGLRESSSTAIDHHLPSAENEVMVRRLNDGREFRVVKNFWSSGQLEDAFRSAGFRTQVRETATYFQYGVRRRMPNGEATTTHAVESSLY